jgi:hypothetical protein
VRSWWHGSKVDRHHVGYFLKISDTWALWGNMVMRRHLRTTTIWHKDRRKPMSTLGWEWMMCKNYLGTSTMALKQTRKAFNYYSYRSCKLRARIQLVAAIRLQAQHSSFRLRTSSNMPFVPMNVAHVSFHKFQEGNALSILQLLS